MPRLPALLYLLRDDGVAVRKYFNDIHGDQALSEPALAHASAATFCLTLYSNVYMALSALCLGRLLVFALLI